YLTCELTESRHSHGIAAHKLGVGAFEARLSSEANRGVGRAVSLIAAALDDLEEHAFRERSAVELEVFGRAIAVVQDSIFCEPLDELGRQAELRLHVVVVIAR